MLRATFQLSIGCMKSMNDKEVVWTTIQVSTSAQDMSIKNAISILEEVEKTWPKSKVDLIIYQSKERHKVEM